MKPIATLFVFESDSSPGKQYQALLYIDGTTSCDCMGWTRRNPPGGRTCKHTRFVDAGLANQHAVKVVEYSTTAQVPRRPQRAMPTATFTRQEPRRSRMFDLDENTATPAIA